MPVKLLVSKRTGSKKNSGDDAEQDAFIFDQERITIGRDPSNLLVLPDRKKIVGRQHAEIHRSGAVYQVIDLGSKNFTYLEGERLEASRPYPLHEGDVFKIGDFEIQFTLTEPAEPDRDRTVFVANPFTKQAEELADLLRRMGETYEQTPGQREAALQEAFKGAIDGQEQPETVSHVIAALGGGKTGSIHDDKILDMLLRFASALAGIPSRFRHEFIGQTIVQSEESSFLYDSDPETLRRHLFDPTISDEELTHRLSIIDRAAEDLALHQVALLDGYKASILVGVQRFLDILDPDVVERQLAQEHTLFRLAPLLGKLQVLRRLRQACRELRSEDWAAAERRVFRPAFVRAYLKRMTSRAKHDAEVEPT